MRILIKNKKRTIETEVIAENGKRYFVNVSKLKDTEDIKPLLVIWNYFRNKVINFIKKCNITNKNSRKEEKCLKYLKRKKKT